MENHGKELAVKHQITCDELEQAREKLVRVECLEQNVEDLKLAAWAYRISSGCGCCANIELNHEAVVVQDALEMNLLPWVDKDDTYSARRAAIIENFQKLRQKLKVKSYAQEFYGEDDDGNTSET